MKVVKEVIPADMPHEEFKTYIVPTHWGFQENDPDTELMKSDQKNKNTIKYVSAPNYHQQDSYNDLKKLLVGPTTIDMTNHARYSCPHVTPSHSSSPPQELCRLCYMKVKKSMEKTHLFLFLWK